jgi:quercetin dioxygenase-like cupin family protein
MNGLRFATFVLASVAISIQVIAQTNGPSPVLPDTLVWASPRPGVQVAWVVGADKTAGPYILRVKLAAGAQVPPHTHPDERNSTVLTGTIYVGFGDRVDKLKVVAIPVGGVYVAPAGVAHYIWAKDGEATYQESGVGPTATIPIKP